MRFQKRQTKTAPGDYEILSLTRAKLYLLESNSDQDDVITDLINSAVAYLEQSLDFFIDTDSTIYQFYDRFPGAVIATTSTTTTLSANKLSENRFIPVWHRYMSGTANDTVVSYWNGTAWVVFDAANYRVDNASVPNRITLNDGCDWPEPTNSDLNSVRVSFKVDTTVSFYKDLKAAVMSLVASRYENREMAEIAPTVKAFIDRHRIPA